MWSLQSTHVHGFLSQHRYWSLNKDSDDPVAAGTITYMEHNQPYHRLERRKVRRYYARLKVNSNSATLMKIAIMPTLMRDVELHYQYKIDWKHMPVYGTKQFG